MSAQGDLPTALRSFIYACIDAIESVEVLIGLRASARPWTAREVSAAFNLGENTARAVLESLVARGLLGVQKNDELSYFYDPKSADLRLYSDLLAAHYATNRAAVVSLITAQSRGLRTFSEAFKLRDSEH